MKLSVLQPPYPAEGTPEAASVCLEWMDTALDGLNSDQDLILLPEYANTPGLEDALVMRSFSKGEGATFLERLSGFARRYKCRLAAGTLAEDGGVWHNRTIVLGADGGQWFSYDKLHLTEFESDKLGLVPGLSLGLTSLDDVSLGVATCFDVYFPEYFSALSYQSIDLVFSPSYQRSESPERLRCISQTRAVDNDCWFVRSSYAIADSQSGGHSMIVAPDGEIVVDANHEPGVIQATIDPKRKFIKPRSHGQPDIEHGQLMSRHRRPDVYRVN